MTKSNFSKTITDKGFGHSIGNDFHQQVAEGIRRAPIERSKAIRSFWTALFK